MQQLTMSDSYSRPAPETYALMYAQVVKEYLGTAEKEYYKGQPKLGPSQKV